METPKNHHNITDNREEEWDRAIPPTAGSDVPPPRTPEQPPRVQEPETYHTYQLPLQRDVDLVGRSLNKAKKRRTVRTVIGVVVAGTALTFGALLLGKGKTNKNLTVPEFGTTPTVSAAQVPESATINTSEAVTSTMEAGPGERLNIAGQDYPLEEAKKKFFSAEQENPDINQATGLLATAMQNGMNMNTSPSAISARGGQEKVKIENEALMERPDGIFSELSKKFNNVNKMTIPSYIEPQSLVWKKNTENIDKRTKSEITTKILQVIKDGPNQYTVEGKLSIDTRAQGNNLILSTYDYNLQMFAKYNPDTKKWDFTKTHLYVNQ